VIQNINFLVNSWHAVQCKC